jgi:hypothetical protein
MHSALSGRQAARIAAVQSPRAPAEHTSAHADAAVASALCIAGVMSATCSRVGQTSCSYPLRIACCGRYARARLPRGSQVAAHALAFANVRSRRSACPSHTSTSRRTTRSSRRSTSSSAPPVRRSSSARVCPAAHRAIRSPHRYTLAQHLALIGRMPAGSFVRLRCIGAPSQKPFCERVSAD